MILPTHHDLQFGKLRLHYIATEPAAPLARLIVLHGYGDHAGRYEHFMSWLAERQIAVYALDFRGHGRSGGRVGFVRRWNEYLNDLAAFLDVEQRAATKVPLFVLGHSHGGLVTVAAAQAGLLDQASGVVLCAPYLKLKLPVPTVKRLFGTIASQIAPALKIRSGINGPMLTRDPVMADANRGDPYCPGIATPRWFTTTLAMQSRVMDEAPKLKRPLFMLVAGDDTITDSTASTAFFNKCGSTDKTLKTYPEHRHELLRELGRELIFQDIFGWLTNHIIHPNPPAT